MAPAIKPVEVVCYRKVANIESQVLFYVRKRCEMCLSTTSPQFQQYERLHQKDATALTYGIQIKAVFCKHNL